MSARESMARLSVHGMNLMVLLGQELQGGGESSQDEILGSLHGLDEMETCIVLAKYTGSGKEEWKLRGYMEERTGLINAPLGLMCREFLAPNTCVKCHGTGLVEERVVHLDYVDSIVKRPCTQCEGDGVRVVLDATYASLLEMPLRYWQRRIKHRYRSGLRSLMQMEVRAFEKVSNHLYEKNSVFSF